MTKPAGEWRYEDLLSLPNDGRRYEIIEGEMYELPPGSLDHATAVVNLLLLIAPSVHSLGGTLVTAPVDVFFQGADPVEPDIVVLLPGWQGRLRQGGHGRGLNRRVLQLQANEAHQA